MPVFFHSKGMEKVKERGEERENDREGKGKEKYAIRAVEIHEHHLRHRKTIKDHSNFVVSEE